MTRARQVVVADIAARIAAVARPHPVRVAIDGVDAAGKTTLADELRPAIDELGRPVIRASIDGFHRPRADRYRRGPSSPEGYYEDSFDHTALVDALLQPLGSEGSGSFRRAVFDFRTDAPVVSPVEHAPPSAVLLLDGVFLLRPELRDHFDYSVFVRAEFSTTIARAAARDVHVSGSADAVRRRYQERYIPGQQLYLERAQPERWASLVLDNDNLAKPRIASC
jgi:uridine kinase